MDGLPTDLLVCFIVEIIVAFGVPPWVPIARIPTITPADCESLRATGTLGREASTRGSSISPTVGVRNGAIQRDAVRLTIVNHASDTPRKNPANAGFSVQISDDSSKRAKGFEPSTFGMEGRRSTTELRPQGKQ